MTTNDDPRKRGSSFLNEAAAQFIGYLILHQRRSDGQWIAIRWMNEERLEHQMSRADAVPSDHGFDGVTVVFRETITELWISDTLADSWPESSIGLFPPCESCPGFGTETDDDRIALINALKRVSKPFKKLMNQRQRKRK